MNGTDALLARLGGVPLLGRQLRAWRKRRIRRAIAASNARDAFTHIYRTNYWGGRESASGNGSSLASTEVFRAEFTELLLDRGVSRLFDAPCGDFHWMRLVAMPARTGYIGADIVPDLIERCAREFGGERREFRVIDIINEDHPSADLWLCRDGLFHFSEADIFAALRRFLAAGTPWCLLTTHPYVEVNRDIRTGLYREMNLARPPFNFPEPELYLRDTPQGEKPRLLGLWSAAQVASVLSARAAMPLHLSGTEGSAGAG